MIILIRFKRKIFSNQVGIRMNKNEITIKFKS